MYMRKLSYLLTFLSFFLFAGCASATTYYIDHGSGSDANNGTSKTTPWMHAPGMLGCTAICASTTPNQGDSFILKGGVTWPNAVFPDHWVWSGTSGSPIYVGVDKSWYAGAAWVRPIFDAGGVAMSYNSFFQAQSISHVQFDNIEMKGLNWSSNSGVSCVVGSGSTYLTVTNLYIHGWTHTGSATLDEFACIKGDTNPPFALGDTADHIVFDGTDSTNGGDSGAFTYAWPTVTNSVIHDVTNGILMNGQGEVGNNAVYNIHQSFDATEHENAIEAIGGNGIYYIHDNVISGSVYGENMMIGNTGETDYIWNNVIASASGNPIHFPQSTGKSNMNMYAWNNTIVPASGSPCFLWVSGFGGSWNTVDIRNNQCITTSGSIASSGFTVTTLIVSNNAMMTPAQASAAGYLSNQTYKFSPTTSNCLGLSICTLLVGTNLSAFATGPLAGLQNDTSYACTQQTVGGVVQSVCPSKTTYARANTWEVGAYHFGGTAASTPPPPPTNIIAIVK